MKKCVHFNCCGGPNVKPVFFQYCRPQAAILERCFKLVQRTDSLACEGAHRPFLPLLLTECVMRADLEFESLVRCHHYL